MKELSIWATNSLALYRGNNPSTILRAIKLQNKSVVYELMNYFGAKSQEELAFHLSVGF